MFNSSHSQHSAALIQQQQHQQQQQQVAHNTGITSQNGISLQFPGATLSPVTAAAVNNNNVSANSLHAALLYHQQHPQNGIIN